MAKVKVRYKGIADERIITAKDLKGSPAEGSISEDLVWNQTNLFSVEVEASEGLIEVLKAQEHFTISEVKDEGVSAEPETIVAASNPDNPGDTVVDGTTGAKSVAKK